MSAHEDCYCSGLTVVTAVPTRTDTIAHLPFLDALANSGNTANDLMSGSQGAVGTLSVSSKLWDSGSNRDRSDLQANAKGVVLYDNIRVTHAAGLNLHKHLVLARQLQRGLLDAETTPRGCEGGFLEGSWEGHGVVMGVVR
jgi:hypothetical protein